MAIEALSAEPTQTNTSNTLNALDCVDTISRQAAIDVLEERLQANGYSNTALVSELNRSIGYLMQLPSAEPRWMPVTERKPDEGYRVIVTDFGYVEVARWFDGRWYDIDGNTLKGVTAWMPLPEPWKGADDE